jgi:hypothetical protein
VIQGARFATHVFVALALIVRDVSTYCIGPKLQRSNRYWAHSHIESYNVPSDLGATFSWQGLSIAPRGSTTVGVVFQTAVFRGKPVLSLSYEVNGVSLCVSGTISNAGECTLCVMVDGDLSKLVQPGNVGTSFDLHVPLADLGTGADPLLFWAVDQTN